MIRTVLEKFSTEELRAELKRRSEIAQAERNKIMRCRMCQHYGTVHPDGKRIYNPRPYDRHCPYQRTKNGRRFRSMSPSAVACEEFSLKRQ